MENGPRKLSKRRRIVVGYDGSPSARRALELAASLATDDTVVVVAVVTSAVLAVPEPFGAEEHGLLLNEALDYLVERGVHATTLDLTGSVEKELACAVKDYQADLLVVGTHSHGPIARLALGSVSSGVVQRAECSVLVVP